MAASLPDARYVQGDITEPEVPERLVEAASSAGAISTPS